MGRDRLPSRAVSLAIVCIALTACAPSPARSGTSAASGSAASTAAATTPSRVTVAIGGDATNLASKLDVTGGVFNSDFKFMTNSPLVVQDPKGNARPLLAAEIPSRDNGTWVVNTDGTMVTTWKIRPNAFWHDGAPVVSSDVVFAFKVYMDDAIAVSTRDPERLVDRVEALDEKTFNVYWKQVYPNANRLGLGQLEPLPEHIVGTIYEADREAFQNASFWTSTSFVGDGPYRLADWDKGVQLVYRAFDQFFLGKPQIDEVTLRIIADMNTVVSNVLSGTVDTTVAVTLNHQAGATVKQQWEKSGEGQVASTPTYWRNMQIQHDPNRAKQPGLQDRRVRQALVYGIDRASIAEVVTAGASPAADSIIPPNDPRFDTVQRSIARYPFDRNRAAALLAEAGYPRSGDTLMTPGGQPFGLEIWTSQVSDNETEMSLVAADYTALGMQMVQSVIPIARNADREFRAEFPGLNITATSIDIPNALIDLTDDRCPRPENRFAGSNRGCWSNPEFETFFRVANTALDDRERDDALVQALRVLTEDVGTIPMSYNMEIIPVRKGLVGPAPRWPQQPGNTWNVFEWRWS
ncbi:MAG TPA: ABC transporter substrate-binding protein [Chloroflexota bacterium]|nr:ABC transporter substrate-binding protein [Chloroflexota bacterium]